MCTDICQNFDPSQDIPQVARGPIGFALKSREVQVNKTAIFSSFKVLNVLSGSMCQIASACATGVVAKITFVTETVGEVFALNVISSVASATMRKVVANDAGKFATEGIFAHILQKLLRISYRTT